MSDFVIRPFRRDDRDRLTRLVNRHIAAVNPGASVSVNTVLSRIERRPEETILDPWVIERMTLVAEQRGVIVAAAHLLRYGDDARVSGDYRDAAAIEWFLAPVGADEQAAADGLMTACLAQFARWRSARCWYDGKLPAPAVYGLPDQWPHLRALLDRTGWVRVEDPVTEIVLVAATRDLHHPDRADLTVRRSMGELGTVFTAYRGDTRVGALEIDTDLTPPERISRGGGWADVCDAEGEPDVLRWLFGRVADWLRLGAIDRLLDYRYPSEPGLPLLLECGFTELTRIERGWRHPG